LSGHLPEDSKLRKKSRADAPAGGGAPLDTADGGNGSVSAKAGEVA